MSTTPHPASSAYMLLLRNSGPELYAHLSPAERQEVVQRFNTWFEALLAEGKAVEGQPLEDFTRVVSGPGGARVVDGPFPEAKEAVAGYVKVLVSGLEEATAIARRHPGLDFGMLIEVRELTPDCHLGVTTKPVTPQRAART
ncbi:MAG TPA: YciI family protein [Opitutus sp.]|nr:YciI family protein [Opitutus sp.]